MSATTGPLGLTTSSASWRLSACPTTSPWTKSRRPADRPTAVPPAWSCRSSSPRNTVRVPRIWRGIRHPTDRRSARPRALRRDRGLRSPSVGVRRTSDLSAYGSARPDHSPVELETNALRLLGVGIALAGAATLALLLRAERRAHEHDEPTLRALGYTSRQLGAVALLRTTPVAIGGAVTAMVFAVALSPRFPVGIGRQLELDGGLDVDAAIVIVGGAVIAFFVGGLSYLLGRAAPRRNLPRPRRTLADRLAGAGFPTEVVIGTQFAFGGGSRSRAAQSRAASSAVPSPSPSSWGSASTSQESTTCTPHPPRTGGHGTPSSATPTSRCPRRPSTSSPTTLGSRPRQSHGSAALPSRLPTAILAVRSGGTAPPVLGSGRLPASASEIALGARLARDLDAGVGDLVRFSVGEGNCGEAKPAGDTDLTVVGIGLVHPRTSATPTSVRAPSSPSTDLSRQEETTKCGSS